MSAVAEQETTKITPEQLVTAAEALAEGAKQDGLTVDQIIQEFEASPDFTGDFESLILQLSAGASPEDPALSAIADQALRDAFDGSKKVNEASRAALITVANLVQTNRDQAVTTRAQAEQQPAAQETPSHVDTIGAKGGGRGI